MNHEAFHFGVPKVPLAELYHDPAVRYISERGGVVRPKTTADQVLIDNANGNNITGVKLQDGEVLTADRYIFALQSDLLLKFLPAALVESSTYWSSLAKIELSPIVGIHLWFETAFDCPAAIALLDRDTEWIFNKNLNFNRQGTSGTYLSALISASQRFASTPNAEILERVLADVHEAVPASAASTLTKSSVIKWPKATFSPLPGVEAIRPDQRTPIHNLLLAGEWTQTGWPSTMESAAISGHRAAAYILDDCGKSVRLQADPLRYGRVAALLDGHRS